MGRQTPLISSFFQTPWAWLIYIYRFHDAPDIEEPTFVDADGDPQKHRPVCNTTFPADLDQTQFEQHVDSHYGRECPICQQTYPSSQPQEEFENHVQQHFENTD